MNQALAPSLRDTDAPRPAGDDSLVWSDARALGFTPMDDVHQEFFTVALGLVTCTDANAMKALLAFEEHAVEHFAQEDEWMRTTEFPPRGCHMDEHAAVLASIAEIKGLLEDGKGGANMVRDFGAYLYEWFPGHADYLDSALAAWMTKRATGGRPIVFRRSLASL